MTIVEQEILTESHMEGKVCLVTGATAGIGKIVAIALASMGVNLIITGRNQEKAEDTVRQIKTETGNQNVRYLLADFSNLQEVRSLAENFKENYSQLDVLVNNAGAYFNTRQETPYGVEMTLLVNHLAPFLLTNLLLKRIQTSPSARIINVSSVGYKQGTMNFDDLSFKQGYFGMKAYGRSKLANILFTYELARRLGDEKISINALHPGHVTTDIWKNSIPFFGSAVKWIVGLFALTPEEGADNTIYLASSPDVAAITGRYFVKHDPAKTSALANDKEIAKKLWEVSEEITGLR